MYRTYLLCCVSLCLWAAGATAQQAPADTTRREPEIWFRAQTPTSKRWEEVSQKPESQTFLTAFHQVVGDQLDAEKQYARFEEVGVDVLEMELFERRMAQHKWLKAYPNYAQLDPMLRNYAEAQTRWNYWHLLLAYPVIKSNVRQQHKLLTSLPPAFLDGFEKIPINEPTALVSPAYRNFLNFYVTYFNSKKQGFQKYADMGKALSDKHQFAFEQLSGEVYSYFLARMLDEFGLRSTPEATRQVFGILSALPQTEFFTQVLQPKLAEHMAKKELAPVAGKPSNSLQFRNIDNQLVGLDFFKGKVVYVDFWASWCGPCRTEMPFSRQLMNNLTTKQKQQVVFLYINIDEEEENWRKALDSWSIKDMGYHVISQGGWTASEAVKKYGIRSIPRYMLVNKKGEMVYPSAPRPSDQQTINEILKLLE
jgi:thiol-disulfide isomerase/thioredoxin